jgi:CheY-like chemotaxis protein
MSEKKAILVVDDEEDIRILLQDFLESRNYHVLTAVDGSQAMELTKKHVPDLIITDMLLPKVHGVEVAQLIKDSFFIPVVGISGIYKKEEINQKIDDFYLDGFFEKPIDLEALYQRIQSILNG